jgi:hypothetical protein
VQRERKVRVVQTGTILALTFISRKIDCVMMFRRELDTLYLILDHHHIIGMVALSYDDVLLCGQPFEFR